MSLIQLIDLPAMGDERGSLVAIEANKTIPFSIERVYYIFATKPEVARGFHAHYNLQQLAFCVAGRCRMILDDGSRREEVWLDNPAKGLLISDLIWREMHDFSEDCVLMVLASQPYDENDYIREYPDFIKQVNAQSSK